MKRSVEWMLTVGFCFSAAGVFAQIGGIRGTTMDKDFDVPLPGVTVRISETGQETVSSESGSYVVENLPPGVYTPIFSKSGYGRVTQSGVVVVDGQLSEVEGEMAGEYEEMDELVVRDIQLGGTSEVGLLNLRMDSVAMMDSVGADLMSKAGASDAAQALQLVPGATVQDGKYAVVRGLPDRYVSSQMNGVRLPTADVNKRAVQLDQFPAAMIESMQVAKTFTPDQQGDASGGAVNVVLKGIPEGRILKGGIGYEINSQVAKVGDDFLTYNGGGVSTWGGTGNQKPQTPGTSWDGAVGVSTGESPINYKWGVTAGDKIEFDTGFKFGAVGSIFYKQDASYFSGGKNDALWVDRPGEPLSPQYSQGTPQDGTFYTDLYDVTGGSQSVQWGTLGVIGAETENHSLSLLYSFTESTEDKAILQENTRGKAYYQAVLGAADNPDASPYVRNETLAYTDRTAKTMQLRGNHVFPIPEIGIGTFFQLLDPEVDWTIAQSSSGLKSPDKRQFGSAWYPESVTPGFPAYGIPDSTNAAVHRQKKAAANYTLGNVQRIWQQVNEDSDQVFANGKLPFEQWSGDKGYLKMGVFHDEVKRSYTQDSYSNFEDNGAQYEGAWADYWSTHFPSENHPITPAEIDVNYDGEQKISAWYYMLDLPLCPVFSIVGGARYETTELSIVNMPEADVKWYPNNTPTDLNPGDADVNFKQHDVLPSIGFELRPIEPVIFRGTYSETVARQTFKELTPIVQQEYLGADVFIGNPNLQMSAVQNYDLRLDYAPYPGGLVSFSWFRKDIDLPIEYQQELADFVYTTAVNYPSGQLNGYEIEVRQALGRFWDGLEGLTLGCNATVINSSVKLPASEQAQLASVGAPTSSRDMLNAPEYLYNLNMTYELERSGTELGLFYSVKGDTLVGGAGTSNGKYIPDVYEKEWGSLNISITQKIGDHFRIAFKAKNLTDPAIEQVYRSEYTEGDTVRSSYTKGITYSIDLTTTW